MAITILIGALGGEGGGVLAQWLVEAATPPAIRRRARRFPASRSAPARRRTTSRFFRAPLASLGGRGPVLSLFRCPAASTSSSRRSCSRPARIVAHRHGERRPHDARRVDAPHADHGREDGARATAASTRTRCSTWRAGTAGGCVAFDMEAAAREAGTVVSAVMFGAIAGSGVLPFGARRRARRDPRRRARGRREPRGLRARLRRGAARRRLRACGGKSPTASRRDADRRGVPACDARARRARQRAPRRVPGRRLRGPLSRARCARARRGAARPIRPARHGFAADARDGALSRAVDGVRRRRARRGLEVPREPLRARAARSRARRTATSCASSTTSSRAFRSSPACCRRRSRALCRVGPPAAGARQATACRSRCTCGATASRDSLRCACSRR